MKNVKLILVFSFVALLLTLVLIRYNNPNLFRKDAKKWAAPSLSNMHILSTPELNQTKNPLFIVMEKSGNFQNTRGEFLKINAADLLQKNNLKRIKQHSGEIILVADDIIKSSRIWMILSQMGIQNVYMLTDDTEENLKYEFRPDSLVRPEF